MGSIKKIYDLYGLKTTSLENARHLVESSLSIALSVHESAYRGGEYFRLKDIGSEHFILQRNFNSTEEEWVESEFKDIPFLLYVNETNRSDEIKLALENVENIRLLQHQEL